MDRRLDPRAEVLLLYGGIAVGTALLGLAGELLPVLDGYVALGVAALFFVPAYRLARRRGLSRYGLDLGGLLAPPDPDDPRPPGPLGLFDLARALRQALVPGLREAAVALAVAAVVFPPFVAGFAWWNGLGWPRALMVPHDYGAFLLTQLVVVALPEEAFFRGYVQTRWAEARPAAVSLLGLRLPVEAWLVQALLFALIHLVAVPSPDRLAVFFPGLLFGLLRAWRGGIGAAMLLHAMSNGLAELLSRGWVS